MSATLRLPLAVFLLLSGFYLLTMSGHTYSADEETMLAVTRSLLNSGSVDLAGLGEQPLAALRPGRDDGRYSPYGVLPSLLALPIHALAGVLAAPFGPGAVDYVTRFAVSGLNGPITAATAALLTLWALRLMHGERSAESAERNAAGAAAVSLGLTYGLCTFAWPYARSFFSEPLAGLLLMLAAERVHHAACTLHHGACTERGVRRDLLIAGLACGLLLPTRIAAGVAIPVIGLYLLWACWPTSTSRTERGRTVQHVALYVLHVACALLPGLLILVWYNLARFGTPLASGYASETGLFTTPLADGLFGLLLSPGKSVLLFAPPLLLALVGGVGLWRRGQRDVVLLLAGLFLTHLLLYAQWGEWEGGGVWGPRFLLPVVAPLLVLCAGLWPATGHEARSARAPVGRRSPLVTFALALALLGFAGNLGGTLLNFGTYVVAPEPADKLYTPADSPLVGHWRLLAARWGAALAPAPVCRLGDGLHRSEDPDGASLPRRTGARGELRCSTAQGGRISFTLDDRRPPEAPSSELRLLLNGQALPTQAGQLRAYSLLLPPGETELAIVARTWNPLAVGFSERNDELGPQLAAFRGRSQSGEIALVDTAVAPLPTQPRPRWAWYYDPPNAHMADHWAWYLPRSELRGAGAWALGGLILLLGAGCLAGGMRALGLRRE